MAILKAKLYSTEGKATGEITLPESVFRAPWNPDLLHQVVVSMQANARTRVAHTKDRSEVRGGGKKPWRQKGTARARHGSRRSPLWIGGGVTFGPRNEKRYEKKINKKMRVKALYTALSRKWKEGEILFVDRFVFDQPKTAEAKRILSALAGISGYEKLTRKPKNAAFIGLASRDQKALKSFRNMGNVVADGIEHLNPLDVLAYKYLIIEAPEKTLPVIEGKHKRMGAESSQSVKAVKVKVAQPTPKRTKKSGLVSRVKTKAPRTRTTARPTQSKK